MSLDPWDDLRAGIGEIMRDGDTYALTDIELTDDVIEYLKARSSDHWLVRGDTLYDGPRVPPNTPRVIVVRFPNA